MALYLRYKKEVPEGTMLIHCVFVEILLARSCSSIWLVSSLFKKYASTNSSTSGYNNDRTPELFVDDRAYSHVNISNLCPYVQLSCYLPKGAVRSSLCGTSKTTYFECVIPKNIYEW